MKKIFEVLFAILDLYWAIVQDVSELIMEFFYVLAPFVFMAWFIFIMTVLVLALVG